MFALLEIRLKTYQKTGSFPSSRKVFSTYAQRNDYSGDTYSNSIAGVGN